MEKFVYSSPVEDGYREVKITRKQKNEILRKINYRNPWTRDVTKYVNDDGKVLVEVFPSLIVNILETVLCPLALLLHGVTNWKEWLRERTRDWNAKKYGAYVTYTFKEDPNEA